MIEIKNLYHSYRDREVLKGLTLSVEKGEIFGLLGPNGSGKTTLMRILCTVFPALRGDVQIAGIDLKSRPQDVRKKIGVVFQSPSLDGKLTVMENLLHQGRLYGLFGRELKNRAEDMLSRLGILERASDRVEKLSGGLKRRAEIAKSLLHRPELLLLDEPSTGLDPGSRHDVWRYLQTLSREQGVTVLVTTHLMEEAELCSRVAILNHGMIVALGKPEELKRAVSGDIIQIQARSAENLSMKLKERFQLTPLLEADRLQIEHRQAAEWIPKLAEAFPGEILAMTLRKPTLGDVFMHQTGRSFEQETES